MLKKILACLLVGTMMSNVYSFSVSAIDNDNRLSSANSDYQSTFNALKFQQLGLTDSEIQNLLTITDQLTSPESSKSVSDLMKEYHTIMDKTLMSRSQTFTSTYGGTLYLTYTGTINPLGDVIYQKIVYFNNQQVEDLLVLMGTDSLIETFKNVLMSSSSGVTYITNAIAQEIGATFGIPAPVWMVGVSIQFVLALLESVDVNDLADAVNRSSNGKVLLEYFYAINSSYPYYLNLHNFEPWDDGKIVIPDDYDYDWVSGVYDYAMP